MLKHHIVEFSFFLLYVGPFVHLLLTVQKMNVKSVQYLNIMKNDQDHFEVLRKIREIPDSSQREIAEELGFSLGKLNYCLKSLQKKGLVKLKNFQKKPNKISYLQYVITPKGISERTRLTVNFMKKKMKEYDDLKSELNRKNKNVDRI